MSSDVTNRTNAALTIETAAITDRGLSEKRPVNEDSFLSDAERGIFAVADGVGGAQSGEVASQTAIETLDEAFRKHEAGDDAEDLMEIAFQRANLAIHEMSRQRHKLAMMATTIVALHIDGARATLGHVGDSRIYRLTPDGELRRETDDHSVVEEEVRAGRMTEAEAQHHPNKNIISRALGAEANVEADTCLVDVAPGSIFLLCSDGITRHVPDDELRDLLLSEPDLHRVCDELKRRCYERGAEDNLTAVLVRVGASADHSGAARPALADRTATAAHTNPAYATGDLRQAFADFNSRQNPAPQAAYITAAPQPKSSGASRIEVSTAPAAPNDATKPHTRIDDVASRPRRRLAPGLIALLILGAGGASAFYYFDGFERLNPRPDTAPASVLAPAEPTPEIATAREEGVQPAPPVPTYAERREAIDEAPQLMANKMWQDAGGDPTVSADTETVYLYGRALLGSGRDRDAQIALRRTLEMMRQRAMLDPADGSAANAARMNEIETVLRSDDVANLKLASNMIDEMIGRSTSQAPVTAQPSPSADR